MNPLRFVSAHGTSEDSYANGARFKLGIKKMLHLVWSKDNNSTSEDGKELKGIRSRLLECYRSLYFDALPDLEPKQQVNRIAKNMIEYDWDRYIHPSRR